VSWSFLTWRRPGPAWHDPISSFLLLLSSGSERTSMPNAVELIWILLLVFRIQSAKSESIEPVGDCIDEEKEGYSSRNGCLLKQATPLRVLYLDAQYTVQNNIAIAKIKSLNKDYVFGKTCGSIDSIPEW
jgi:hypothetical protein